MKPSQYIAVKTHRHELLVLAATHRLEYRVRSTSGPLTVRSTVLALTLLVVPFYSIFGINRFALLSTILSIAYWWFTSVIWESIIVYPPNGLQLETCRGFTFFPFVSRKFVPNVFIKDIIINEGLRRWSVRYYLALMTNPGDEYELIVAYKETLPHFPILLEVYQGVIECLNLGYVPNNIFERGAPILLKT